jgi:NAD+ synthase
MDLCLFGLNNDVPVADVAAATALTEDAIRRVYKDIETKRQTTRYLHQPPVLVRDVAEISHEPLAEGWEAR